MSVYFCLERDSLTRQSAKSGQKGCRSVVTYFLWAVQFRPETQYCFVLDQYETAGAVLWFRMPIRRGNDKLNPLGVNR